MRFDVGEINIDVRGHLDKVRSRALWHFAAVEWRRLYEPWAPYREGILYNTVRITANSGCGQIEHIVPYAHRQYEGNFNHRRDQHPRASRHWDEAAAPTQRPKLIQSMQNFIDRGGLNLGGP